MTKGRKRAKSTVNLSTRGRNRGPKVITNKKRVVSKGESQYPGGRAVVKNGSSGVPLGPPPPTPSSPWVAPSPASGLPCRVRHTPGSSPGTPGYAPAGRSRTWGPGPRRAGGTFPGAQYLRPPPPLGGPRVSAPTGRGLQAQVNAYRYTFQAGREKGHISSSSPPGTPGRPGAAGGPWGLCSCRRPYLRPGSARPGPQL